MLPNYTGTCNDIWADLVVLAFLQVRGITVGTTAIPLPKGLPEIREWLPEILWGPFGASTLLITMAKALGDLHGGIKP